MMEIYLGSLFLVTWSPHTNWCPAKHGCLLLHDRNSFSKALLDGQVASTSDYTIHTLRSRRWRQETCCRYSWDHARVRQRQRSVTPPPPPPPTDGLVLNETRSQIQLLNISIVLFPFMS